MSFVNTLLSQLVAALESPVEDIELTANLLYLLHWLLSIVQHDMVSAAPFPSRVCNVTNSATPLPTLAEFVM